MFLFLLLAFACAHRQYLLIQTLKCACEYVCRCVCVTISSHSQPELQLAGAANQTGAHFQMEMN